MALPAIAVRESIRLLSDELGGRKLSLPQVSALMTLAGVKDPFLEDLGGPLPAGEDEPVKAGLADR